MPSTYQAPSRLLKCRKSCIAMAYDALSVFMIVDLPYPSVLLASSAACRMVKIQYPTFIIVYSMKLRNKILGHVSCDYLVIINISTHAWVVITQESRIGISIFNVNAACFDVSRYQTPMLSIEWRKTPGKAL